MKKKFSLFLKILLTTLSVLLLVTTFPVKITADDESGIGSEVDQQEILEQEEDAADDEQEPEIIVEDSESSEVSDQEDSADDEQEPEIIVKDSESSEVSGQEDVAQNANVLSNTQNTNTDNESDTKGGNDAIQVSSWDALYEACQNAPDNVSTTIVLSEDITRPSDSDKNRIEINDKKVIVLDLNDKTLHANRTSAGQYYHVLDVHEGGNLTVLDSGFSGTIKGGYANYGGGIYISEGGTCTIEGGTISSNYAKEMGGGIYTEGTLIMTGGTISGNCASSQDGGGIYCTRSGMIQLKNVYIRENDANDYGSGIMIVLGNNDSYIQGCYFEENGKKYFNARGGGIYVDAVDKDKTLNITDSLFDNNWGLRYGGGIYLEEGTIQMTGGRIASNGVTGTDSNNWYGGGVYVDEEQTRFIADSVLIDGNRFATVGKGKGAGIYNNKGTVALTNCTLTDNKAGEEGGGIYEAKAGWLTLTDTKITNNSAAVGGGVYFEKVESSDPEQYPAAMRAMGNTVISDNEGSDVYLPGKMVLVISQNNPLGSEASIGITHPAGPGKFTMDFERYMPEGSMPDTYFFSNDGYMVTKHEGEGYLALDLDEAHKFLKQNERVNTNVKSLSPANWMSGVSGERYLNEINIPGTHDTAMNNVSSFGCLSGDIGAARAKTQKEYLFEQLDNGARFFDIRMKTYYCEDEISAGWLGIIGAGAATVVPIVGGLASTSLIIATPLLIYNNSALPIYRDDGENLWACHGRSLAGTFYAQTPDDETLSIAQELKWMKEFLRNHPTETIIIDARPETDESSGETYYGPLERLKGVLEEMSTEINPSTNEPYIYWEDGIVGKKFEHWPQLKDVRGKIVFFGGKGEEISNTIGGFYKNTDGTVSDSGKGGFKDGAKRGENLADFFETHNTLQIPRDAMKAQMEDFYWMKLNTTDPWQIQTPVGLADKYVLPVVFGSDGYVNESKKGTYFGWFSMDAARTLQYRDVWITNFPDDLDYCTITVKSGLGEAAPDQIYKVLRGSTITIPGCIYDGDQADYFKGWKADVDNKIYIRNNKYRILKNVTFTAQWSNDLQTPVTVVWKDAEDLDGIRPTELSISYNGSYTETIKADKDWTIMLSGDITVDPAVIDVPDGYTAKVDGKKGKDGYTITMVHTPDVKVNAKGTIAWVDENDADGIRPSSVTLHLYKNGVEVKSEKVSGPDWKFDLGTYKRYEDGEFVSYKLVEDEIKVEEKISGYSNGVEAVEGERNAITGFKVTNTHEVTMAVLNALIDWDDDNDAAGERPESVTVQWLKDGKPYGDPIVVSPDEDNEEEWAVDLKLTYAEIQAIGKKQDALAEKYKNKEISEEEFIEAVKNVISYSIEQESIDNYITTVEIKTIEGGEGETGTSYYQILNTYQKHEHKLTKTEAKEATCTEDGNSAYWTCDQGDDCCGKYFSDAEGKNEIKKDSWILPALGHDWSDWTMVKAPSPSQEGEEEHICSRCKEKETQKYMYSCTDGEGNTWNRGSKNAFTFTFKRSVRDEVTFDRFSEIQIDGKKVDETNFSKEKGSLILTFEPKYLDSLSAGKHQLKVIFSDGSAEASFKVSSAGGQYVIPVTGIIDWNHFQTTGIISAFVVVIFVLLMMRKRKLIRK